MTQGKPMKLIFDFAMPMMIGSLFQQLYNTVDAVIMGKYEGPDALASIAAAFPLMFFMMSAITGRKVRADVAMTGEITLRGRVLPIGGLKEKLLAAKTAGMKTVLVPKENEKDVEEISREIKNGLDIILVESMEEVIKHAFVSQ